MPADILLVDFNVNTPSPTQSGYTSFGLSGSATSGSITIGAYTVSVAGLSGTRDRNSTGLTVLPSLYQDLFFGNPGPWTINISGLTASTDYDVRFFAFDKNQVNADHDFVDLTTGSYGTTWTVFNTGAPTTDFGSSVLARLKSNASGVINIRVQTNGGSGFPVCNGLIVTTVDAASANYRKNHALIGC